MIQWRIQRRTGACSACEHAFEDGERHASTLCLREDAFAREDLCRTCWDARGAAPRDDGASQDRTAPPPEDLFWWFTRHSTDKKKTLALDLDSIEKLFLQLEGREEQPVRELRYLLCLLLMRKRRVKVEKIQRDPEGESFLVKRPRRDQRYTVYVYDFTEERMDELRTQMQSIFEGAEPGEELGIPSTETGVEGAGPSEADVDAGADAEEAVAAEDE